MNSSNIHDIYYFFHYLFWICHRRYHGTFARKDCLLRKNTDFMVCSFAVASRDSLLCQSGHAVFIYKFYPYYNDNLPQKNDMLNGHCSLFIIGFIVVLAGGIFSGSGYQKIW